MQEFETRVTLIFFIQVLINVAIVYFDVPRVLIAQKCIDTRLLAF